MSNRLTTPFFLLREELLEQNINSFKNALKQIWPNSIIAYSVKTNALPWILTWMNQHNVYAEVVSDEEYDLAALSGYSANRIVFNGPIKSELFLKNAFEGGSIVNIDSKHEVEYILEEKPVINGLIGVRVNVEPSIFSVKDVGYQDDGFRFGFSERTGELQNVIEAIEKTYGNIPIGLHFHVNSISRSKDVYRAIASFAADVIKKYCLKPAFVDIGGGFFGGIPGKTTPEEYIRTIKNELESATDITKTKLIIEPGSAAVGSTIELHTSVVDVKDTTHGRIVTTDGSRIHIDPLWIKKQYNYTTDSQLPPHPCQVICGYTCMDHDRLMIIKDQPELMIGNQIVYHRVGNYTVTFGGPFIRPFPPVYVQNEQSLSLIRKQMTMKDYYRMETN